MNMEDTRFIKSIRLRNLLSFGPDSEPVELKPLNVLIGPNASGKSNFIDAISILQAAPRDISMPLREGGGVREWIWKGKKKDDSADIETVFNLPAVEKSICHFLSFSTLAERLSIDTEIITFEHPKDDNDFIFRYLPGRVESKTRGLRELAYPITKHEFSKYNKSQSVFTQLRDPLYYPELSQIEVYLDGIKIYKYWDSGTYATIRSPQKTDYPGEFLLESMNNFAMIVHNLKERREIADIFKEKMQLFYHEFESIQTNIIGGTIQVSIYEKGYKEPIPATRLSDGTLRYLCLLLILCHPSPPPLICIEEPEIGLHPDILHTVAELLVEASKRTQLIVTTHSDILVSALSEQPESILVCEHDEGGTHMKQLEQERLKEWLKKYSLGELWLRGQLGGVRW